MTDTYCEIHKKDKIICSYSIDDFNWYCPECDTEKEVHDALDDARTNDYEPMEDNDILISNELCMYNSNFENFNPETLIPHIKSWKNR